AFVAERFPFALDDALAALEVSLDGRFLSDAAAIEALRPRFEKALQRRLKLHSMPEGLVNPTPRVTAQTRIVEAQRDVLDACDGFLRRLAIEASLTADERREILRGMVLTRATDNRLKAFFTSGEVRYGSMPFQGKGFRSLGQEAIYAAAIRLRRGPAYRV